MRSVSEDIRATPGRPPGTGPAMLLAAAAAILVYSASLPGVFQYDDVPTIVQNESIRDATLAGEYFTDPTHFSAIRGNGMYRPVLLLTYLANHRVAGYEPIVWHLTNVLLHGLNAALVVLLAARLLRVPGLSPGGLPSWFPLLSGLAFGLHPLHSEVVNYVSARSGAIATAGFLGALVLHLIWTRGGGGRVARGLALAGSLVLYLTGLGGKEIAIALVPAVALMEILDHARGRWRRVAIRTAPLVLVTVLYLVARAEVMETNDLGSITMRVVKQESGGDLLSGGGRTPWENLLTQSRVFWMYVRLSVLPIGLAVDRYVRVSTSPWEPTVLLSIAGILALVIVLFRMRRTRPLVTFGGLLVLLGLAPTSSFLPLNIVMNEHRMYLPGVGVAILAGLLAAALVRFRPRAATVLLAGVAVAFGGLSFSRSLVWQDSGRLWASNVRVSPRSYRAHNQLGAEHFGRAARIGSRPEALPLLDAAIAEYERAAELYPRWYDPHLNLGIAFRERARITGDEEEWRCSIREFETCLELVPEGWRALYQLATTYGARDEYEEAIRRFGEMADLDRDEEGRRLPIYLFPMARLELERGRPAEAEELYREILATSPGDPDAYAGVAKALADSGRPEEGAVFLGGYADRRPRDPVPHLLLARYLADLEPPDRRGALAHFRKALELGHRATPEEVRRFME